MNKELSKVDSLVIFVMSHGRQYKDTEEVEIIASDGHLLRTRWIISQFTNQNPSTIPFENKPKLFFFQTCRYVRLRISFHVVLFTFLPHFYCIVELYLKIMVKNNLGKSKMFAIILHPSWETLKTR